MYSIDISKIQERNSESLMKFKFDSNFPKLLGLESSLYNLTTLIILLDLLSFWITFCMVRQCQNTVVSHSIYKHSILLNIKWRQIFYYYYYFKFLSFLIFLCDFFTHQFCTQRWVGVQEEDELIRRVPHLFNFSFNRHNNYICRTLTFNYIKNLWFSTKKIECND